MLMYEKSLPFAHKLLSLKIQGGRLLDVGGAECALRVNMLSKNVDKAIILDIKEPTQELAENVSFINLPVEELAPEQGKFDHILLSNVLEHLKNPGVALKKCAEALADNGSIHILSPNCESLNRRIGTLMGELSSIREITAKEAAIGHLHEFTVSDVKNMIAAAGLELSESRGIFLKPVPTQEMINWTEARIQAFFDIAPQIDPELCHEVYFRAIH